MPSDDTVVTTASADGITAAVVDAGDYRHNYALEPGETLVLDGDDIGTVAAAEWTPSGDVLYLLRGATEQPRGEHHPLPCGLDKGCGFGADAGLTVEQQRLVEMAQRVSDLPADELTPVDEVGVNSDAE